MRHPDMHCIVALFLFGPGGAWQTRPAQHCESFVHFDWGNGPAILQPSAPAGTGATKSAMLATSARRAVRQSDFVSDMGPCTSGPDAARIGDATSREQGRAS